MIFNIRVIKKNPIKIRKKIYQKAIIIIGNFSERFWIPLDYWNIEQYKKQWKAGINRLKIYEMSCLITKINIEQNELSASAWILYKQNDIIRIQHHFFISESNNLPPLSAKNCYLYIKPHSQYSSYGNMYKEWIIPVKDFKFWFRQIFSKNN